VPPLLRHRGVSRQGIAGQTHANTYQQERRHRDVRFFVIDYVHRYLQGMLIKWQPWLRCRVNFSLFNCQGFYTLFQWGKQ
jgi:hypothetical protein